MMVYHYLNDRIFVNYNVNAKTIDFLEFGVITAVEKLLDKVSFDAVWGFLRTRKAEIRSYCRLGSIVINSV